MKIQISAFLLILFVVIPCSICYLLTQKNIKQLIKQNEFAIRYYDKTIETLMESQKYIGMEIIQISQRDSTNDFFFGKWPNKDSNFAFLWYPRSMCESCFTSSLNVLSSYLAKNRSIYPIIMTNSSSIREIRSISNSYNIRCEIVQITPKSILDTVTKPMLFKLAPNRTIIHPIFLSNISEKMLDALFKFNF